MEIHFESFEKNYIADILKEIYYDKTYAPYLAGRKNLTILDLGANIGLFSLYAKQFAEKVIAVEPSSQIFPYLEKNIKDYPEIKAVKAAIGGKNGSLKLYGSDVNLTMFSATKTDVHSDKPEVVKQITIETLLGLENLQKVDFMKLDIEGAEFETLASDSFLKVAPKIETIMGEIHSWTGRNPNQVCVSLEEAGYKVKVLSQQPILFVAEREQ